MMGTLDDGMRTARELVAKRRSESNHKYSGEHDGQLGVESRDNLKTLEGGKGGW